jgi:glycine cleavage system P protein (glycine dehydrogenase) subunit 2
MRAIAAEARDDPELLRAAPHSQPVGRLDEVKAVKELVVKHGFEERAEASTASA